MNYYLVIAILAFFSYDGTRARDLSRSYVRGSATVSSISTDEAIAVFNDSSDWGEFPIDEDELVDYEYDMMEQRSISYERMPRSSNVLALSPLDCNDGIEFEDCTATTLSSLMATVLADEEVVIPCGSCVTVDYTDGSTVTFDKGLNIQGKLYFPPTASVEIYTTHVFVMGALEMDPPADQNIVKFQFFGTDTKFLYPVGNNEGACGDIGCEVGKKPFVVAGGKVKIQGLSDPTCPSWVKLVDLKADLRVTTMLNHVVVGKDAASCWKVGGTIVLSSPHKDMNKNFETQVIDIDREMGELIVKSPIPTYFTHATLQTAPDFAVEVATLGRSIIFDADNDDETDFIGGHFMIYHTPHTAQLIEGVEIINFGQQGNLGRYPLHFHMSGDVSGSIVSKNVVHHSNQRGFVVHGSHNVYYKDNVGYEIFGHCFMIEDGIETGNIYKHNLAMGVRVPNTIISGENDDHPSAFWISNPKNRFIENVAAGSENNGFWFDLRFSVRGPSFVTPGGRSIRPIFEDVTEFRSNTAHSNRYFGMRYYTRGWRPRGEENILKDCRIYRNSVGHFIHSDTNIGFVDGIIADNGLGVKFFQNSGIRFDNITLKGHTQEYDSVIQEISNTSYCDPRVGIELYMFPIKNEISTRAMNLRISDFDSPCATAFTMSITQMYERTLYRSRDEIGNITFEDDSSKISLCNAMSKGANSIAIHDLDGSLDPNENGMPGFIVSDELKMTTFAGGVGCTPIMSACAQFCQETCLRQIRVIVSGAFFMKDIDMVISDGTNETVVAWTRYEYEDMFQNTLIGKEPYIGIGLPTGSYDFYFHNKTTREPIWPGFAILRFEDPPLSCTGYATENDINLKIPKFDTTRCSGELLFNGNFDNLTAPNQMGGWMQNNLDLKLVNQTMDGTGYALRANRKELGQFTYISQFIDRSCLGEISLIKFVADIRLEDPNNVNNTAFCFGDSCPKAKLEFIEQDLYGEFSYFDKPSRVLAIGSISSIDPITGWYKMEGSLLLNSDDEQMTDIVILKIYLPSSNANDFIIDNVSLTLTNEVPSQSSVNLALNKTTEQAGTLHGGVSSLAVDGDTSYSSCIHTRIRGWWEVDLEVSALIGRIKIYSSYSSWHLTNAYVSVLDSNKEIVAGYYITEYNPDVVEINFESEVQGRYVHISVKEYLVFCEIEVYGIIQNTQRSALDNK